MRQPITVNKTFMHCDENCHMNAFYLASVRYSQVFWEGTFKYFSGFCAVYALCAMIGKHTRKTPLTSPIQGGSSGTFCVETILVSQQQDDGAPAMEGYCGQTGRLYLQ